MREMMESVKDECERRAVGGVEVGGRGGAKSRLNYHLERYRLLFPQNGCYSPSPTKGLASNPKSIAASTFNSSCLSRFLFFFFPRPTI